MVGLLRGCLLFMLSPVLGIMGGIAAGRAWGVWNGILAGFGTLISVWVLAGILSSHEGKLTYFDCIIPTLVGIACGIVFAPVHWFAASFFSFGSSIFGGVLFSLALILFKNGRLSGFGLVFPALTFVYEALPINLPSDIDDVIGITGAGVSFFFFYIRKEAGMPITSAIKDFEHGLLAPGAEDNVNDSVDADNTQNENENDVIDVAVDKITNAAVTAATDAVTDSVRKGITETMSGSRSRKEALFLQRAKRFLTNDGKIDETERGELDRLAKEIGIEPLREEELLEQVFSQSSGS